MGSINQYGESWSSGSEEVFKISNRCLNRLEFLYKGYPKSGRCRYIDAWIATHIPRGCTLLRIVAASRNIEPTLRERVLMRVKDWFGVVVIVEESLLLT